MIAPRTSGIAHTGTLTMPGKAARRVSVTDHPTDAALVLVTYRISARGGSRLTTHPVARTLVTLDA